MAIRPATYIKLRSKVCTYPLDFFSDMSSTTTITEVPETKANTEKTQEPYRYAHLLPVFPPDKYPPLTPFTHVDAGSRALNHPNPRAFLDKAEVIELTPKFGSDIRGVNLAELNPDAMDELALEVYQSLLTLFREFICALQVARRGVVVFRGQQDFFDRGPEFYRTWGRHFGRLHIHPSSGHPEGFPEIHLVYK